MSKLKKIIAIVGTRPQFIKHFPFEKAAKNKIDLVTIHTGQHYDNNMSAVFFEELGMNRPDYMLQIGSGSHGEQTGKMMIEIEKICLEEKPDGVLVYGDTNSTLAGAIVASKLHIPVIHVEAGLRSFNKEMPEEVNRVMTDHVADLLLVPSQTAVDNLLKEGLTKGVYIVGDIMKDLVVYVKDNALYKKPNIKADYYYATLHRPYNVDEPDRLQFILSQLNSLDKKVIFAAHPRTINRIDSLKNQNSSFQLTNIELIPPQGYLENLGYLMASELLITDSGGMQKEAYWLNKKCITIRSETEWVETINGGANTLIFNNIEDLKNEILQPVLNWDENLYGDGKSSERIIKILMN